jgi:mono/diheme cytochrome c family protein
MKPLEPAMNRLAFAFALLLAAGNAAATTKSYQSPPDTVTLKASDLPGYARAQAVCSNCHSAEYMLYQPPSAGRPYWETMVKRMKVVFKAQVPDADMPLIIDYLVKTYGNEQPKP